MDPKWRGHGNHWYKVSYCVESMSLNPGSGTSKGMSLIIRATEK